MTKTTQTLTSCEVPECDSAVKAKKLCSKHYQEQRRIKQRADVGTKPITRHTGPCLVNACNAEPKGRGYCASHYQRFMRYGDPLFDPVENRSISACIIPDCTHTGEVSGLCRNHYSNYHYRKANGAVTSPADYVTYHSANPPYTRTENPHDLCVQDACDKKTMARGLCSKHYQRQYQPKPPKRKPFCQINGCNDITYAKNYCGKHYRRALRSGTPYISKSEAMPVKKCVVNDCQKPATKHELCSSHVINYELWKSRNIVADPFEYMAARNNRKQIIPEKS